MYSKLSRETYFIWGADASCTGLVHLGEHALLRLKPKFNPPSTSRIDTILANMRGGRATDIHRPLRASPRE